MPVQVLPNLTTFEEFRQKIEQLGYREILPNETGKTFIRLGLSAPRKKNGGERGFCFEANGLKAYIWTTFLRYENKARNVDLGWGLITQGDEAKYFFHPLRRTKNFLDKLLVYAEILKNRVLNRPLCPKCQKFMNIAQGHRLGSRYFYCLDQSHKFISLSWDSGLPEKDILFLKAERKKRAKYRQKRRKLGLSVDQARIIRKKYKINKPENQLKIF